MNDAACAGKAPDDPDEFDPWFPKKGESGLPGQLVCLECPVRVECKDYRARTNSNYGMWGAEIVKRPKAVDSDDEEDD